MSPRIVLITGANSGVGLATAQVLTTASTSYHVVIASRTLAKAESAKSTLITTNPSSAARLSTVELDVTSTQSITAALKQVESEHGRLDALINNAAIGGLNAGDNVYERYTATLATNVTGPAVVSDAFRPLLLKSSNPYSIFISSGAGSFSRAVARAAGSVAPAPEPPGARDGAYHVSKAALNMIALREHHLYDGKEQGGLKVFAMCPGFVVSNLRGTSEEMRSGWGKAGEASVSGETVLGILEGERDADVGGFVHKDGVYGW